MKLDIDQSEAPTVADVLDAAEGAITLAQAGYGGTLELEGLIDGLEEGSEAWDVADTMRVYIEEIESVAGELADEVHSAETRLRVYRVRFGVA